MKHIGFIGLGNMGKGVCHCLIEAGYPVSVYDLSEEAMKRFAEKAYLATDTAEVFTKSDITFLSLPSSEIVEKTFETFFSCGVFGKTVVDLSTSNPVSTRNLSKRMKAEGGVLIDAPLSGSPETAWAGEMNIVIAGDSKIIKDNEEIFKSFTKSYEYVGESGNGHLIKLAKNWASLIQAINYAQIYPVIRKHGIPEDKLYHIFDNEVLANWVFHFYSNKYVERKYPIDFALQLGYKDICYMSELCKSAGSETYMLDGAMKLCEDALEYAREREIEPDMSFVCEQVHHLVEEK